MSRIPPETLVIPVETLNREFDGKLLLALAAAERGYRAIVGGRTRLHRHLTDLPPSIYLSKGIRTGNRVILSLLEKLGHTVVALEEEGLVRFSDEAYLMMLDVETFNRAQMLFAWGHDNAEVWRRFGGYRGTPIIEAGNPRMDMLRPEVRNFYTDDVAAIRQRYGRFALFNSNFSFVNHFIPGHIRFRIPANARSERYDQMRSGVYQHKKALFDSFCALIPSLSKAVQPHNLVIRPHPSENRQTWRDVAAGLPNVHVVYEGTVVPWLLAADVLVHNSCTSGVEAAILGTPALSYRPVWSAEFDPPLPNDVSSEFDDAAALGDAAQAILARNSAERSLSPANYERLSHHVAALDGKLSCDRILDALVEQQDRFASMPAPGLLDRAIGHAGVAARNARRAITTRMMGRSSATYTAYKFPGLDEAYVATRIERFCTLLGRFDGIGVRRLRDDIFLLERR
ncbi:MAG: surface carbohydrate biosynthesis protein [Dongiaceae bacterium]